MNILHKAVNTKTFFYQSTFCSVEVCVIGYLHIPSHQPPATSQQANSISKILPRFKTYNLWPNQTMLFLNMDYLSNHCFETKAQVIKLKYRIKPNEDPLIYNTSDGEDLQWKMNSNGRQPHKKDGLDWEMSQTNQQLIILATIQRSCQRN